MKPSRRRFMNSKRSSMPSLEEAVEDLRSLLQSPKYDPTQSSEQSAFYAGQLWAIEKLIAINDKYKKGDA
jgi:hypothetical protein